MSNDFEKKLKQMNDDWKQGKDTPPGPPDGTYAFQLQACRLRESESSGNLYIHREHLIVEGEHDGSVVYDIISLVTERGPYFAAKFMDQMGYESPDNAAGIPETLKAIENEAPTYTGIIKHSGDFVNVRIQEVTGSSSSGDADKESDPGSVVDQKEQVDEGKIPVGTKVKFTDSEVGEVFGIVSDNTDLAEHHVTDEDNELWGVSADEIEIIGEDGVEPKTIEDDEEDLIELIALAQACDVDEINADDDIASVVSKLSEYEWDEAQLTEDEIAMLHKHEIETKGVKKSGAKKKK